MYIYTVTVSWRKKLSRNVTVCANDQREAGEKAKRKFMDDLKTEIAPGDLFLLKIEKEGR